MNIWSFLLAAVGPLAIRALTTIGFTAVSFVGVQTVTNQLVSLAQANWAALPAGVLALSSIGGVAEGLGLIAAACAARVTLWMAASSARLIFTGGK